MKFPSHISLDFRNNLCSRPPRYWIFHYFELFDSLPSPRDHNSFKNFFYYEKIFNKKKFSTEQGKFIIRYSCQNKFTIVKEDYHFDFFKALTYRFKVKRKKKPSLFKIYKIKTLLKKNNKWLNDYSIIQSYRTNLLRNVKNENKYNNFFWNLFDLNFLKKEKIYTKLKYSRVPQYDIVSGGGAALFAGFLGFLICEKFGFELLDSGDFYILLIYLIFFFFSLRLLLQIILKDSYSWNFLSLKWFFSYYKILANLASNFFKLFF
jgi:hypothetical protein